jgi:putative transposase
MVADGETTALARKLLEETFEKQNSTPGQPAIHSDRGRMMRSKRVTQLYADRGATESFSRPYVSGDHAFSESQFRTLKYRPDCPRSLGCQIVARAHCQSISLGKTRSTAIPVSRC